MAGWIVLILVLLFLAVLLIRTALFRPKAEQPAEPAETGIDYDRATDHLAQMIRVKTVSSRDPAAVDEGEFERFRALLRELYPLTHEACPPERIGPSGLLFHWKGKESGAPTVLMAHYDVVPPGDRTAWKRDPFCGEIDENGVLWGRGTLDTKGTLCGILEAAETLMRKGFTPAHDVYLSFSGDEEIMGASAPAIVEELQRRGIRPALVLDEGGAIVEGAFPGVKEKTAVIGTCEKGQMDVEISMKSKGGHTSAPPPKTPVATLCRAVAAIDHHPFPAALTPAAAELFDTLGRHSTFALRLVFANLWCFLPVLKLICTKAGGELNALMRTTCCFTMMEGSQAANAIPTQAKMTANLRLSPRDTMETAQAYLRRVMKDEDIELHRIQGTDPSPISPTSTPEWARVRAAVKETWPQAVPAPYMMVACSDSRHFCKICGNVFRFSAMELSKEERGCIHGLNERVPVEKIGRAAEFFTRVLLKS